MLYTGLSIDKKLFDGGKGISVNGLQSGVANATMYKDKDEKGNFFSVMDTYDFGEKGGLTGKAEKLAGNPYEIYDRVYYKDYGNEEGYQRMYYNDKELRDFNPDEKEFDTLALQRELENRGFVLPESKNKYKLDGVYGDETRDGFNGISK